MFSCRDLKVTMKLLKKGSTFGIWIWSRTGKQLICPEEHRSCLEKQTDVCYKMMSSLAVSRMPLMLILYYYVLTKSFGVVWRCSFIWEIQAVVSLPLCVPLAVCPQWGSVCSAVTAGASKSCLPRCWGCSMLSFFLTQWRCQALFSSPFSVAEGALACVCRCIE